MPPHQIVRVVKIDGTRNPADALTKHLAKPLFKLYAVHMYNCHADVM